MRRGLPFLEQLCYAVGDTGFNLLWVLFDSFLLYFLVEVARLPDVWIAPILFCARLSDLLVEVVFGVAGSRLRTFRTTLLWVACPLGASFVVLFTLPTHVGTMSRNRVAGWTCAAAVIFAGLYAVGNAAYTALLATMTRDEAARVRVASLRFAFAAAGVFVVQYFVVPFTKHYDSIDGWSRFSILCAAGAVLALVAVATGTREAVEPVVAPDAHPARVLRHLRRAKGLGWLVLAMMFCLIALSCRGAASPFYFEQTVAQASRVGRVLAASSLAALVICTIVPAAIPPRWLLPTPLAITCAAAGALLCLLPTWYGPTQYAQLLAAQISFGAGTGLLVPTLFVLLASRGQNWSEMLSPALLASVTLMSLKIGSAAGTLLASFMLTPSCVGSGLPSLSSAALSFTVLPAVFLALTAACLFAAGRSERGEASASP